MSTHPFKVTGQIDVDATPEQVWEAISTGPGVDSWFMGRSEIDQREGGKNRMTMFGETQESTITAWEPGRRFAHRSPEDSDGTFMAFDMLLEAREGGSTTLRFVHNGFLGDDWEDHYDALRKGDLMYLKKLATYLTHFTGQVSRYNMFLIAPAPVPDGAKVWAAITDALSLDGSVNVGDKARLNVPGLPETEGVVEFVLDGTYVGVRTDEGMHTLMHGFRDAVVAEYHAFTDDIDPEATERAWNNWLATVAA